MNKIIKFFIYIIKKITKFHAKFQAWKPIHLCWWFEKHNLPIPPYLIGGPAHTYQRYYKFGTDNGDTDPDNQTFGNQNENIINVAKETPFFIEVSQKTSPLVGEDE